jgi:hypothetical protein
MPPQRFRITRYETVILNILIRVIIHLSHFRTNRRIYIICNVESETIEYVLTLERVKT